VWGYCLEEGGGSPEENVLNAATKVTIAGRYGKKDFPREPGAVTGKGGVSKRKSLSEEAIVHETVEMTGNYRQFISGKNKRGMGTRRVFEENPGEKGRSRFPVFLSKAWRRSGVHKGRPGVSLSVAAKEERARASRKDLFPR